LMRPRPLQFAGSVRSSFCLDPENWVMRKRRLGTSIDRPRSLIEKRSVSMTLGCFIRSLMSPPFFDEWGVPFGGAPEGRVTVRRCNEGTDLGSTRYVPRKAVAPRECHANTECSGGSSKRSHAEHNK